MEGMRCEVCEADNWEKRNVTESLRYRDGQFLIEFEEMICASCGKGGYTTPEQGKALTEKLIAAHRKEQEAEKVELESFDKDPEFIQFLRRRVARAIEEIGEEEAVVKPRNVTLEQAVDEIREYMKTASDEADYFDLVKDLRIDMDTVMRACSRLRREGFLE